MRLAVAQGMRPSFVGFFCALTAVVACSSSDQDAARAAAAHADGGSGDGAANPAPDGTSPRADAAEEGSPEEGGADGPDGSEVCESKQGPAPDFFVRLPGDVDYDGPVTVELADAQGQALVGRGEAGSVQVLLGGPAVPDGATLWASLRQHTTHANPYNTTVISGAVIRASEHGPVLAETLHAFVPGTADQVPFLGASMSASVLCTVTEYRNTSTNQPCLTRSLHSVTIHGDTDLTLTPVSEGHVMVNGIEYVVWLSGASSETRLPPYDQLCVFDWAPYPGLSLTARAVRYRDVLNTGPRDAGADSRG